VNRNPRSAPEPTRPGSQPHQSPIRAPAHPHIGPSQRPCPGPCRWAHKAPTPRCCWPG